jgi:MFS family permease
MAEKTISIPKTPASAARLLRGILFAEQDKLPVSIWVIFAVQVVNRIGDFVAPFLTLLFTRKMGLSASTVGLLVTATAATGMAGNLVAGKLCDHFGRKKILAAALFFVAVLNGSCGFFTPGATTAAVLVAAGFFQGSIRPAISAMLADSAPADRRRQAWSLSYLGINIGASIGPLLAGLLFERNLPWLFWGDALSTFAAIGLLLAFIPETKPDASRVARSLEGDGTGPAAERAEEGSALGAFFRRPVLVGYSVVLFFSNFIYGQTHFCLPLYTQRLFGEGGAEAFGLIISCNGLVVLLFTNLVLRATRRVPALAAMAASSLLYAVGFAGYIFKAPLPFLLAATAVWTIGEILSVTNGGAWVASRTPMNFRGRFQSIQYAVAAAGAMLSPLLGGFIVERTSVFFLWGIVSATALLCALAFRALKIRDEASDRRPVR